MPINYYFTSIFYKFFKLLYKNIIVHLSTWQFMFFLQYQQRNAKLGPFYLRAFRRLNNKLSSQKPAARKGIRYRFSDFVQIFFLVLHAVYKKLMMMNWEDVGLAKHFNASVCPVHASSSIPSYKKTLFFSWCYTTDLPILSNFTRKKNLHSMWNRVNSVFKNKLNLSLNTCTKSLDPHPGLR